MPLLSSVPLPVDFAAALDAVMLDHDDVFRYEVVSVYVNAERGNTAVVIKATRCCSVVIENNDVEGAALALYQKVKASRW